MKNASENRNLFPVFFLGHGNPMNAIYDNAFTKSLFEMEKSLVNKPDAILVISAHWLTRGSYVSTTSFPEMIYDFSGFPEELYKVVYPSPGAPEYAKYLLELISTLKEDDEMGLDHGAWTVLKHMFPKADIPVFQLSIDFHQPMQYHFDLGKKLLPLREKNVLIIGSGNIVHNLHFAFPLDNPTKYKWAIEFDEWVKGKIGERDFESLINYHSAGDSAKMSVPTTDHYIPMLYCFALTQKNEEIKFTYEEIITSLSMRCFRIG
ncbi:MAG: 4,5-DOPA dioxygenase extradiol [Ignavibacteriae bacterium]|nr:4,5-DOPA dioxygenase extradiol [Ignavibacteriota bacterium]